MYNEDEINLITLCSFFQLTYNQRKQLLSGLENSRPDFVKYEKNLIKTLPAGVYNKVKADFYDVNYRNKVLESLKIKGVTCVTYFSEDYPQALKNTALPPIVLYCKGNLKLLKERCFAVVGSRRTLPDITAKTKKIAKELSEKFVVVTGMADGADAAVCEGGAQNDRIISVLAYGFDHVYPAVNANLIKIVEKRGLLLSEYPPEIPPQRHNFPIRNRIIAGLSEGTLIVSAGKKSGALITAEYSEEYGRETFAFPYGIGVTSGEGCNHIIKNYAHLAENTFDILSYFGLDFKTHGQQTFTSDEEKLLDVIKENGASGISELAEVLGVPPFRLIPVISSLEIKGAVVRLGGNRYAAAN